MPVDVDEAIARLNAMVAVDQGAMTFLVEIRVHVGQVMADQTRAVVRVDEQGRDWLGVLGLLNAVLATEDEPAPIVAVFGDYDILTHFERNKRG